MAKSYKGSIRATPAGGWEVRWRSGPPSERRRHSRSFEPGTKKQTAWRWLQNKIAETERAEAGELVAIEDITFSELAKLYREVKLPETSDPETRSSTLKVHLEPYFGQLRLSEITTARVDAYKRSRVGRVSANTVNHHLSLLSALLKLAIDHRYLDPTKRPRLRWHRLPEAEYRYLKTAEEVALFLEAAEQDEHKLLHPLYATGIYAGLRLGELAGLRKQDVDFRASVINVRRSYDGPPKWGRIRHVPLMAELRPLLAARIATTKHELVFTSSRGTMLRSDSRAFDEMLERVLARARRLLAKRREVPVDQLETFAPGYISAHGLRHTFGSHFMMRGGDLWRLQRYMGHRSITTTERYAHLAPDVVGADADLLSFAS